MQISPSGLFNIQNIGKNVQRANFKQNFCTFDENKVQRIINEKETALPYIENMLKITNNENCAIECLYILNRMLDNNVKGIEKMYPTLSRFNCSNSPDIQVMLSGIYRKTLIPDAFGPLNRMLAQQIYYPNSPYFDATEEIGGAILEYIRSYGAKNAYKQ